MRFVLAFFFSAFCFGAFAEPTSIRPPLAKPYLIAPIIIDDMNVGEAWIFPRESRRDFAIEAEAVLKALYPYLNTAIYKRLESRKGPEGVLTFKDLDNAGVSTSFSDAALEVRIQVPLRIRKQNDLNLNFGKLEYTQAQRPDKQSGYFNFRFNQSFEYGKLPLAGRVDFVENVNGFVLESSADYLEYSPYPWKRQDTRIRKDDEEKMLRYTVGDLTVPTRGFQYSPAMAGLSVTREFSIQPYRTARPVSNQEIILKRPSTVELYINGNLYSQLRLQPGKFNIRDFPLAAGQNNIRIKVRDDLGQEESFDFSFLYENTILAAGISEFSYNVGMPWRESGGDRAYNSQNNFVSLYHRYGFSNQLTAGLNVQTFGNQSLGGLEISGISNLGYLSTDLAVSQNSRTNGAGGRLRYRSLDRMFGQEVKTYLSAEYEKRDYDFQPVSVLTSGQNFVDSRYDIQLNRNFDYHVIAGLGGGYQKSYLPGEDIRSYRGNIMYSISPWMRIELSYLKEVGSRSEERGLVSFYWNERNGLWSSSAYYDSSQKSTNLLVARSNQRNYDDYRFWGTAQNNEGNNSANLSAEYLSQVGNIRLDQNSNFLDGKSTSLTTLGVSTGVAWVGNQWALTQPINDSFTLIAANEIPDKQELIINPDGNQGEAKLGPRRATVLPNHTSYYLYQVNLDATSLPTGYLLDKEYYAVKPTYRSGILISAQLHQRVSLRGQLKDESTQALSYVAGGIYNEKGQLVDNTFFTNKEGRFFVEGLEPGSYQLVLDKVGFKPISIVVKKPEGTMMIDLGSVTVQKGGE